MAFPDPQQALAAYNAPPPDMQITPQDIAAYQRDQDNGAFIDQLMQTQSAPVQPSGPDPRAALAAYNGQSPRVQQDAALGGMAGAIDQRQEAARRSADAQAETARQQAELADRAAVDGAMEREQMTMDAEEHKAAMAKAQAEIDAESAALRNESPRDRRTNNQRVMGALALALSGFGDALVAKSGGQGHALDRTIGIINTAVDRDLEEQRAAIEARRTSLADKSKSLSRKDAQYASDVADQRLMRAMRIEDYQQGLQSIAARGQADQAGAAAMDVNARLEQEKQQLLYGVATDRVKAQMAAGRANRPLSDKERLENDNLALKNEQMRRDLAGGGSADDPTAKLTSDERKLRRLLTGVAPAVDTLRTMAERKVTPPHPSVRYAPDALTPESTLEAQASIAALRDILLRDESGAAIGEFEADKKVKGWGIDSGDPQIRAEGLRRMLYEYDARLRGVGGPDRAAGAGQAADVQARMDALGIKKKKAP